MTRSDDRIATILDLVRGRRVLDLGAAGNVPPSGPDDPLFLHGALVRAGFSTLAADVAPEGLAWLQRHGYETTELDAEELPSEGETFDSIVAGELIEHLSNPGRFLAGCARRLKPGGRLVLSTPQPFAPAHVLLHLLSGRAWNQEHTCWFDEQTLRQLLDRHDFAVEEVRYVNDVRTCGVHLRFGLLLHVGAALSLVLPRRFRTTLVVAARQNT